MEKPIKFFFLILLFSLLLCLTNKSFAQEQTSTSLWQVETKDGNIYYGKIISQSQEVMRLETENLGIISIAVDNIRAVREVNAEEIKDGEVWPVNAQATRYFFAPNAYGLRQGEAYYQNVWILFNQISVGVTDHFSIGLGTVPLFMFGGASTPVWITPKFSVPIKKDKVNLGGGALIGTVLGESSSFGLAYGVVTFGDRNGNLNLGLGYGFADGDWADTPLVNIGGMLRLSKKGYLVSENYFVTTDGATFGIISLGGRTVWNRFSLDYGGFIPLGETETFFVIPWLGFVVPLGK